MGGKMANLEGWECDKNEKLNGVLMGVPSHLRDYGCSAALSALPRPSDALITQVSTFIHMPQVATSRLKTLSAPIGFWICRRQPSPKMQRPQPDQRPIGPMSDVPDALIHTPSRLMDVLPPAPACGADGAKRRRKFQQRAIFAVARRGRGHSASSGATAANQAAKSRR